MVREGDYKYTYIHQHQTQLFNIKNDPKELIDLSGRDEYRYLEQHLKQLILNKFNPEGILEYLDQSIQAKRVIRVAMQKSRTCWDYYPYIDESRRFSRT